MSRGSTWTNDDGLVVGFGTHLPRTDGAVAKNDGEGAKVGSCSFDWKQLNLQEAINVPIPAGSVVLDVKVRITETWTSTGTNTAEVGDGSTAAGFLSATVLTVAAMVEGAILQADGVYTVGTGATDRELKAYTADDTIDFVSAMVDWTAGKAVLKVVYV